MNEESLPEKDHFARYCPPKTLIDDEPGAQSFMLKNNEPFLSVNWLEYFGNTSRETQIAKIREYIELKLAKTGLFAVCNVGKTIEYIQKYGNKKITILRKPTEADPSHSGICGYHHEDLLIAELIAEIVMEIHPSQPS